MSTPWPVDVPSWIDGVSPALPAPPPPVKRITPTALANPWRKIKPEPVDGDWVPKHPRAKEMVHACPVGALSLRPWVLKAPHSLVSTPLPIDPSTRMLKGGSLTDTDTDTESDSESDWDLEVVIK